MYKQGFVLLLITSVIGLIFVKLKMDFAVQTTDLTTIEQQTKYILFWTKAGSSAIFHFTSTGHELFSGCKVCNCFATNDKTLLPVEDYAAIMFYGPASYDHPPETLPSKRKPNQRYVFGNFEAPVRFYGPSSQYVFSDFYNWTMTYRFDSDLPRRHGSFVERFDKKFRMPTKELVRGKTKMAAWFVSNCASVTNKRDILAKELQKYIDVDIYGQCGTLSCPKSEDCYSMVEAHYKFYLSFENSYCKDYTTEKLYRVLEKNIIPVVYGGGNYSQVAPPHSVINVADFDTVEQLAKFLKDLSEDEDRYLSYFEWKKQYRVVRNMTKVMCKMCEMLNDPETPPKTYRDIKDWWFNSINSGCKLGSDLPKIVADL